jgi:hypothetical protein
VNNSGQGGFHAANEVGQFGWYLFNCNFYENEVSSGVLTSPSNGFGMSVDSCIFFDNTADIGLLDDGSTLKMRFNLSNCVFSTTFPPTAIVSSSNCRTESMTISWKISARLCPTYSVSASPLSTPTRSRSPSPSRSASASAYFSDSWFFAVSSSIGRSGTLSQSQFLSSASDCPFDSSIQLIGSCSLTFSTVALFGMSSFDQSNPFLMTSAFGPISSLLGTDPNERSTAFSPTTVFLPLFSLFWSSSVNQSNPFFITSAFAQRDSLSDEDSVDSRSGHSVGLIVGMTIFGVIIVVICVAVLTIIHRRRHRSSDGSSQSDRETVHPDFTHDQSDSTIDTTEASLVDTTTYERAPEDLSSDVDGFRVDLATPIPF